MVLNVKALNYTFKQKKIINFDILKKFFWEDILLAKILQL